MNKPRSTVGVIFNPVAGRARAAKVATRLERYLEALGVQCELFATARAGHARELASAYASEFSALAGIGGDGTISEIINGLADCGGGTPLAIIPSGTANVIANELGLPNDLRALAHLVVYAPVRRLDLGEMNGQRFALCCGAGLDARIVSHISNWRGSRGIQMLDYLRPILLELPASRQDRIRVCVDGKVVAGDCTYAVVGNFARYGGPLRLFREAKPDDGLLDVLAFRGRTVGAFCRLGWRALFHQVYADEQTILLQGKEIELLPGEGGGVLSPVLQADGDMAGCLPARIRVLPSAVSFCVPEQPVV